MIDVRTLTSRVGPALLRVVVLPVASGSIGDVVIAEPGPTPEVARGDLVLGVAVADSKDAVALVRTCDEHRATAVLLKSALATAPEVVTAVEASEELALVEVSPEAAWAQLVWLIRAALAGTGTQDTGQGQAGLGDLFRLADAVADVVDAPVTIEDAHSQVLAYSARQDLTDPARVSTIMGRRQPDHVLAKFRARGTFRKLSQASSAFYVPAQHDGTLPRLIVPIRMGGELLGSMWAVVPDEVSEERASAFADTAAVVALRLLRWRAVADAERQRTAEQVRRLLEDGERCRAAATELAVPGDAHRVVAIDVPGSVEPAEGHRLALWEWISKGVGRRPLVTEIGGVLYALVSDRAGTDGWTSLHQALTSQDTSERPLIAVGSAVQVPELHRSREQADELLGLLRGGQLGDRVAVYEEVWHLLILHRMAGATSDTGIETLGPMYRLREHDAAQGTDYANTLYAWLKHPGDPRAASRALRVHPNTFRYRMRRVTTIANIDLDDADVRAALLVQLLTHRWAGPRRDRPPRAASTPGGDAQAGYR